MTSVEAPTIRELAPADIANLAVDYCFPWSTVAETEEKWLNRLREHESHHRTVFLIKLSGKIAGYVSLLRMSEYPPFRAANTPEINDLWIGHAFHRQGLATNLIAHLEELARKEGYSRIGLGVGLYKDYGPAQRLYYKLGYVPDGMGITYKSAAVVPGDNYAVDDDLLLWLLKGL